MRKKKQIVFFNTIGLLVFFLLSQFPAYAQEKIAVNGKVLSNENQPLPNVSVTLKNSSVGATTDNTGAFSLLAAKGDILLFSYVGYEKIELKVESANFLTVILRSGQTNLDSVVVISYGSQKKKNITGAISVLPAKQLEDQPVAQFGQKIQGKIAGVQINQTSGKPGEGIVFRIRGAASVNAGNNPLFVVDGAPITGNVNQINPNEIESFSVLKDASASALYGSRAASGVVLITTKKGKAGKTQIEFSANSGIQQVAQTGRPDLMNATEWAQFQKEIYEDKAIYEGYTGGVPVEFQNPAQYGEGTDWYGILLNKNAPISNYSLTLSAAKDKFSSATTFGYFRQKGVMINTDLERYSVRSNNEFRINDNFRIGVNIAPNYQSSQNFATDGFQSESILYQALTTPPTISPYNADGSLKLTLSQPGTFTFTTPNWLRKLQDETNRYNVFHLFTNAYAEIDFARHFRFKTSVNLEGESSVLNNFVPSTSAGSVFETPPLKATGQYNTNKYISWVTENTLTYTQSIAHHTIEALVGYSAQQYKEESSNLFGTDFPDDNVQSIDAATTKDGGSRNTEWALVSLIGRVNYNYKGRYLLSAAVRNDGSSRFGENKRYGTFPSLSAGWIISDEPFYSRLTPLTKSISYLKLRASYGFTGNFNIGNFSQYGVIGSANYVFDGAVVPGRALTNLGNADLTWETTKQLNIGLDIGLLKDRINLSFDYYNKYTDDLLYQEDIPAGSGFFSVQSNIGEFKFWGYELVVATKNIVGTLKWNTDLNISANRSKTIQLGANNTPLGALTENANLDFWRTEVGHPIGQFYGFVFEGIYRDQQDFDTSPKHVSSAPGTVKYKDLNNDNVIDGNDRTFIGDPNPKFYYGFNNSFAYKNFDLNISITGAVGGKVVYQQLEWSELLNGFFNVNKNIKDRWRSVDNPGEGQLGRTLTGTTDLARLTNSRWVFDATYLKLQNITLGYALSLSNKYVNKIRIYASVQNVFTLTKYIGANPEVSAFGLNGLKQGADLITYPIARTITAGIHVGF